MRAEQSLIERIEQLEKQIETGNQKQSFGSIWKNGLYFESEDSEFTARFGGRLEQDWLGPRTKIPGLWLTGQDTLTCGVTGAMMSGMLTVAAMVGMRKLMPTLKKIYG